MALSDTTYEWLRESVSSIETAADTNSRRLLWVTADHSLALARDTEGRLEVFVTGPSLVPMIRAVGEVLEHQVWRADDGSDLEANRLVLPAGEHFDQFGALLCVELVEHDVQDDAQTAFSAVEPLIALALTREMVTDQVLIGLFGELSLLERLLSAAPEAVVPDLLRSWSGSAPSARDFQIGSVGVEVKTTQGSASNHHVEGVHQIELGRSNSGATESALFLLSLGIGSVTDPGQGRSLPEVVDSLLNFVADPNDQSDLLARIKQYGGDAAIGYDHARDHDKPRYAHRFYFRFERLYDMTDDRLQLLTSADLAGRKNVDPGSVTFRIVLEDRVRGVHNPTTGWSDLVAQVLGSAGIAAPE